MENRRVIEEDEIDLRELFVTLWEKKLFIWIFTLIVTVVAIAYAYMKTPIYETKALLEIGSYKLDNSNSNINSNSNSKEFVDSASELEQKLNVLFIDMSKNAKDLKAKVVSISVPKNQKSFLEVTAEGISNEVATQEIVKVVNYIKSEHIKILEDVKQRRELEIKNIDDKIKNIVEKETVLISEKIELQENNLKQYEQELTKITENLKKIEALNPALAALKLMEKRDISNFIVDINLQLMDMKSKRDELQTTAVSELEEKKSILLSMLEPYNYKNTEVVGKIMTNKFPIKPKKKLIVVVAFVTGFILSIFLVFFLEFIKGIKKQDG